MVCFICLFITFYCYNQLYGHDNIISLATVSEDVITDDDKYNNFVCIFLRKNKFIFWLLFKTKSRQVENKSGVRQSETRFSSSLVDVTRYCTSIAYTASSILLLWLKRKKVVSIQFTAEHAKTLPIHTDITIQKYSTTTQKTLYFYAF